MAGFSRQSSKCKTLGRAAQKPCRPWGYVKCSTSALAAYDFGSQTAVLHERLGKELSGHLLDPMITWAFRKRIIQAALSSCSDCEAAAAAAATRAPAFAANRVFSAGAAILSAWLQGASHY